MKQLYLILILTFLFCACDSRKNDSSRITDVPSGHQIANVISNNKITSFAEDSHGHIWIGTDRGLNKYNINEYHQYFSDYSESSLCHNHVQHVYRDRNNNLWVGTADGVNLYTEKDVFKKIPVEELSQNAIQFFEDNDGRLFLNMNVHLCEYDKVNDKFVSIIHDFDPYHQFNAKCHIDKSNKLWVVNPSLLRSYDLNSNTLIDSIPLNGYFTSSLLDEKGTLWLASKDSFRLFDVNRHRFIETPPALDKSSRITGMNVTHLHPYENKILGAAGNRLFIYNRITDSLIFDDDISFPFKAPQFNISTIYTDKEGNLWFGSEDQGYQVIYKFHDRFSNYLSSFFKNISVTSIAISGETLVIHTLDNKIYLYNISDNKAPQQWENSLGNNIIIRVCNDNEGNIWILGTEKTYKTNVHANTLQVTGQYNLFLPISLTQDRNGTIWISSYSENLYALRKEAPDFTSIHIRPKTFTFTSDLQNLKDGRVMAVTFDYPLQFIDPDNWSIVQSKVRASNVPIQMLSSKFTPTCLAQDSRDAIWIGTIGNGLLKYDCTSDTLCRVEDIGCTDICDVQEDNYGNMWISTKYGLNKYDYTTGKVFHFYHTDGIGGNQFYPNSSAKLPDGTLLFGGTHGITIFNPTEILPARNVSLCFENLKIHNELIIPANSKVIDSILSCNPDIILSHDQNSFSISFAALEYGQYQRPHFQYMLSGFDAHWIDAGNNREVFFSNLPAGNYEFKVRTTNPDTNEVESENSINIKILPSPFLSWWAKLTYIVIFLIVIYLIYRIYTKIRKEKEHARFAEQEKQQEKKVNEMNMSFFANISHEFRTPLTLIAGPVAELAADKNLTEKERNLMTIVKRNVSRMQRLVNQILDFHKLENDTLRLQVEKTDMVKLIRGVVENFIFSADQKDITIVCEGLEDSFFSPVDSDKIEKIIFNLLSNAMKYTPLGGEIEISFDVISNADAVAIMPELKAKETSDYIKISIADNGPGFPENQLNKVFDRYYQCEGEGIYNWGTGIGLYYSRKLAIIHHGYLIAENRKDKKGAVMTLCIPVKDSAFSENEHSQTDNLTTKQIIVSHRNHISDNEKNIDSSRKRILVVDDDIEIAHYLKALLDNDYNVLCRHDSASAFSSLADFNPDLVISDIVMPGGSGVELCRDIKENSQYCHIPVILLTAKHTVPEQVEGLDSGADAYITKPFEPMYLSAVIRSTLENRSRLRELLTASTESSPIIENELSAHDRKFMDEIYAIMESELNNSELDLVKVLDILKISRTKLYYKLKGLTGQTPASFFKIYKLNRAAELIKEGNHNISEIADITGFSTLSHFSTSFKKHFGVSPSEYS